MIKEIIENPWKEFKLTLANQYFSTPDLLKVEATFFYTSNKQTKYRLRFLKLQKKIFFCQTHWHGFFILLLCFIMKWFIIVQWFFSYQSNSKLFERHLCRGSTFDNPRFKKPVIPSSSHGATERSWRVWCWGGCV